MTRGHPDTHTHRFNVHFSRWTWVAGCPLNSPYPSTWQRIPLGQAQTLHVTPTQSHQAPSGALSNSPTSHATQRPTQSLQSSRPTCPNHPNPLPSITKPTGSNPKSPPPPPSSSPRFLILPSAQPHTPVRSHPFQCDSSSTHVTPNGRAQQENRQERKPILTQVTRDPCRSRKVKTLAEEILAVTLQAIELV